MYNWVQIKSLNACVSSTFHIKKAYYPENNHDHGYVHDAQVQTQAFQAYLIT